MSGRSFRKRRSLGNLKNPAFEGTATYWHNQWNNGLNDAGSTSVHYIAKEVCHPNSSRAGNGDVISASWLSGVRSHGPAAPVGFCAQTAQAVFTLAVAVHSFCMPKARPTRLPVIERNPVAAWNSKTAVSLEFEMFIFHILVLSTWHELLNFCCIGGLEFSVSPSPIRLWQNDVDSSIWNNRTSLEPQTFPTKLAMDCHPRSQYARQVAEKHGKSQQRSHHTPRNTSSRHTGN